MKVQNVGMTNYRKQQNFGAVAVSGSDIPPKVFGILTKKGLINPYLGRDKYLTLYSIIPTRKGSKLEKKIMQLIGKNAESININEARKLVENRRRFNDEKGKATFRAII
jgi:hypothetical protein